MTKAWKKFDATWTNQGSFHTKILGSLIRTQCIGAIKKLAQRKGLQFYQTQSHAIVLYNTQPVICIEKAVCMKTKEELYYKVCQPTRFPRSMLKPNSRSGRQDQPYQEASQTTKAHREVVVKPTAAATSTTEYPPYPILQPTDRTRIAET